LDNVRALYRTSSIEETINNKMGVCVEQVVLMSYLLDKINIPNKMFCTRIYEDENYNDIDSDIHMHCFLLFYINDRIFQLEHPYYDRKGIHKYNSEEEAIEEINKYFLKKDNGKIRSVTEFESIEPNLTYKELNLYINSLDNKVK
jgi:hypothetical protein